MQAVNALQHLLVKGMPDNLSGNEHLHMLNTMLNLSAQQQVIKCLLTISIVFVIEDDRLALYLPIPVSYLISAKRPPRLRKQHVMAVISSHICLRSHKMCFRYASALISPAD